MKRKLIYIGSEYVIPLGVLGTAMSSTFAHFRVAASLSRRVFVRFDVLYVFFHFFSWLFSLRLRTKFSITFNHALNLKCSGTKWLNLSIRII